MRTSASHSRILLRALSDPASVQDFTLGEWDLLLRQARTAKVLARVAVLAEDMALIDQLPAQVQQALGAAHKIFDYRRRILRWEVGRIQAALRDLEVPILLLKGAAYEMADLPPARGRIASDVDIMVPEEALASVEASLLQHGWAHSQLEPYDQRYFRDWMHELPPLVHRERGGIVDVHHAILPRTSRLKPDTAKLWSSAEALPGSGLAVLSPADMVLHSAAHAFHDGEITLALRDLVDIHDLLIHFGRQPNFWPNLVPRAEALDLVRPLYYALHYAALMLGTPIPEEVASKAWTRGSGRLVRAAMDRLVPAVLMPGHPDHPPQGQSRATLLLYIRSHWLKMPPALLTVHLVRKAYFRHFHRRGG